MPLIMGSWWQSFKKDVDVCKSNDLTEVLVIFVLFVSVYVCERVRRDGLCAGSQSRLYASSRGAGSRNTFYYETRTRVFLRRPSG